MNRIHRKLEYALIAIKHMSTKPPGELTTVKEVCQKFGVPFDATSRVLQILAHKGLLKSEQGAYGGYQIVRDLSRVSVYELIEVILGPMGISKCLHESKCEIQESCNIFSPVNFLNKKLIEFYCNISLKDLLAPKYHAPTVRENASMSAEMHGEQA